MHTLYRNFTGSETGPRVRVECSYSQARLFAVRPRIARSPIVGRGLGFRVSNTRGQS
jgi:hypothetical protein